MKVKLEGVQETLLIPLVARAHETKEKNPRVVDYYAVEMISKIDCDWKKFQKNGSNQGVIARTMILDREVQQFINENPHAVCISIGCGLDTRYHRLKHKGVKWYNLDFSEVISLRKKLLFEGKNVKYIAKSALDISWPDEVIEKGIPILIILEGILMYFTESEVIQLMYIIKNHFPNAKILAEVMNPFIATQTKHHDTVKLTSAVFKWGIESGKSMEKLCHGLQFEKEWNLFDELTDQGILFKLCAAIPFIKNKNNKIVKLRFGAI